MEKIESAAIRLDGRVWSQPKPARHHDVIAFILKSVLGLHFVQGEQGFVTDTGRFVDRKEA
jgi:hypothetical protein